ncbi:MAG: hypothetical protein Q7R91_02060 [bacterium]|nr:hypothetical protein [bacterium]
MVPILRVCLTRTYFNSRGKAIDSDSVVSLSEEKSLVPNEHMRWETRHIFSYYCAALLLPAYWTGENWSFDNYYGFWLVTAEGDDVPVVFYKKQWFPSLRRLHPNLKILSPTHYTYPRRLTSYAHNDLINSPELRLERKEYNNISMVELIFTEGNEKTVLIDTLQSPLATLLSMFQDTSGWREKVLARAIGELRKEITGFEARTRELNQYRLANDNLQGTVECFFEEAIRRFDATKSASRHKVFADFRKFLESERDRLCRTDTRNSP